MSPACPLTACPLFRSRTDLVNILEFTQRVACTAYGVPAAALGFHGSGLAAEIETASGMLRTTMNRYEHMAADVLKRVYVALYGKREGLSVSFPSCVGPLSETAYLYEQGTLTYEAYLRSLSSKGFFSVNDFKREVRTCIFFK